ncbi:MAG: response regulator transcription factor [Gammaproteobacteria bacterium]|nr:response regulator transcription factor [Gammaproteobacteria bacterium]
MEILLVEDHRLVADAMKVMLKDLHPDVNVTACYSTQHALAVVDEGKRFDLVLTDLLMPGIDGLGLLSALQNRHLSYPTVIISGVSDDKTIKAAYDQGAAGYIRKALPGVEMIAGLKKILNGGRFFPDKFMGFEPYPSTLRVPCVTNNVMQKRKPGEKQLQVLRLMAAGNSNKQISQIIGISEATVKYHTSQLFKLLAVKNRTSCVREAHTQGLLNQYNYDQ